MFVNIRLRSHIVANVRKTSFPRFRCLSQGSRSLARSLARSFVRLFARSFVRSFVPSVGRARSQMLVNVRNHMFSVVFVRFSQGNRSLGRSLARSFARSFVRSVARSYFSLFSFVNVRKCS